MPGLAKPHRAVGAVKVHEPVVNQGQGGLKLLWTGGFLPDAMEAPLGQQRADGDVEGPLTRRGDAQGFPEHRGGTVVDWHFLLPGQPVQAANVAFGPVQAHVMVDLLHCSKGGLDGLFRLPRNGMERLTFDRRAHNGQRP